MQLIDSSLKDSDTVFLYFDKKPSDGNYSKTFDFSKLMHNVGGEVYTYESFKNLYDNDRHVQSLVTDFNEDGIIIGDDAKADDLESSAGAAGKAKVKAAAKRATSRSIKSKKL